MLPRKRAGEEGVVVEEETDNGSTSVVINNNNSSVQNVGASFIKKQRIDSDSNSNTNVAAVATVPTTASNIVNDAASLIMASGNSNPPDIDEDLHSRQLAVYGRETMRKLFASNVLISGMQGLGAEIAKNVILAGVKSVTLHDEGVVELWDLSSNFVFSESDVGKNRALASAQKLQDLNNSVIVHTLTSKLVKEQLSDFELSEHKIHDRTSLAAI